MKKQTLNILVSTFITTLLLISTALAGDSCCPSGKSDQISQKSEVGGYQLEYKFIDMKEKLKDMDHKMAGMAATHHLMLFIKNTKGDTVEADKVGFLIAGPNGKDQKVMAMGMGDGYGADVNLSLSGEYSVKTKALIGEQKVVDSFMHKIK